MISKCGVLFFVYIAMMFLTLGFVLKCSITNGCKVKKGHPCKKECSHSNDPHESSEDNPTKAHGKMLENLMTILKTSPVFESETKYPVVSFYQRHQRWNAFHEDLLAHHVVPPTTPPQVEYEDKESGNVFLGILSPSDGDADDETPQYRFGLLKDPPNVTDLEEDKELPLMVLQQVAGQEPVVAVIPPTPPPWLANNVYTYTEPKEPATNQSAMLLKAAVSPGTLLNDTSGNVSVTKGPVTRALRNIPVSAATSPLRATFRVSISPELFKWPYKFTVEETVEDGERLPLFVYVSPPTFPPALSLNTTVEPE